MIPTLYEPFRHWSAMGSVYILSDLHFDDHDCKLMDSNWITPKEHTMGILMKYTRARCLWQKRSCCPMNRSIVCHGV